MSLQQCDSASGPFFVSTAKEKTIDVDMDNEELKDLEVIWNRGFIDQDIEEEPISVSKQMSLQEQTLEDEFFCVTPDKPNQLTKFERQKVSSFLLKKPSHKGEMWFYQFCVSGQDPKCVDVYKLSRRMPSVKKIPKHVSRKALIRKKTNLFRDLFSKDFQ